MRCLKVLMGGQGLPLVATHDPRLIEIASTWAESARPATTSCRCSTASAPAPSSSWPPRGTVRVYLPYGTEWFGYFMRRLAERPANVAFFARSLLTRG